MSDIIDTRDLGEQDGFELRAHLEPDPDGTPDDYDCYTGEQKDAWRNDEWSFVTTVITASKASIDLGDAALCGSEYGWLPGVEKPVSPLNGEGDAFVNGYGPGLIADAISQAKDKLKELGA